MKIAERLTEHTQRLPPLRVATSFGYKIRQDVIPLNGTEQGV